MVTVLHCTYYLYSTVLSC
uniref:Uncharacterized protein n=1 Tax=Arundo donax TaxID=35708 RepID=A0A0A9FKS9_ARUDO